LCGETIAANLSPKSPSDESRPAHGPVSPASSATAEMDDRNAPASSFLNSAVILRPAASQLHADHAQNPPGHYRRKLFESRLKYGLGNVRKP
jgi:hypothetical protein